MTGVNTVSGDEDRSVKKIHADIDESKVKAPNMFERVKEELEAVIGTIHQHTSSSVKSDKMESKSEKPENGKKPHHHKETHGRNDDINENTQVDEVKAPNVFERAKEEFEAIINTIHTKKKEIDGSDSSNHSGSPLPSASPEKARFGCNLGKWLEKICAPWGDSKKD